MPGQRVRHRVDIIRLLGVIVAAAAEHTPQNGFFPRTAMGHAQRRGAHVGRPVFVT